MDKYTLYTTVLAIFPTHYQVECFPPQEPFPGAITEVITKDNQPNFELACSVVYLPTFATTTRYRDACMHLH